MWPLPLPPLIVHIHMPKSGGTSLSNILYSIYGARLLIRTPPNGWRQDWTPELRAEVRVKRRYWRAFSGHITFGIHELFGRRAIYFTSVRDPVERFISYYNYVRNSETHRHHELVRTLCVGEFYRLQRDLEEIELYNFQCQLICGRKDFVTARQFVEKKYSVVAPLSMFDPSIEFMQRQMGWPHCEVPRLNRSAVTASASDLTTADRRELMCGNQADADIVKFCEDLMADRLANRAGLTLAPIVVPVRH